LSEELVALALFDPEVSVTDKMEIVTALASDHGANNQNRLQMDPKIASEKKLASFVTRNTNRLFTILELPTGFLHEDPATWDDNEQFVSAQTIITHLRVVNDFAERGVALMQEYNAILTKN
jgi:hypothetical protein